MNPVDGRILNFIVQALKGDITIFETVYKPVLSVCR
jgi:hypothetical protein